MAHESLVRNPFMLMTHPEVVMAAVEGSERLKQLNRQLCRPLDRVPPVPGDAATAMAAMADDASDGTEDAGDEAEGSSAQ